MRHFTAICFLVASFSLSISIFAYWFQNPELTEMQVFQEKALRCLGVFIFAVFGMKILTVAEESK